MKLGARIFKTGIAIALALYAATLLDLPSPVFAGIAAVFAIQPNIYRSYLTIIEQIQGNIIGAAIAITFVLLFGNPILIVALAAVITIVLMLKLKLEKAIGLALVTLVAIMEVQGDHFVQFALIRSVTIMLGVFSSFIVNLIFLPPKYETKLFTHINQVTEDILKWIRLSSRSASEYSILKKDISKIKERLIKIDNLFLLYKEDRGTLKRNITAKNRKIVVYRSMMASSRKSLDILQRLNQFENEVSQLNPELQKNMQDQLDALMSYHEHLLMRFAGKIKPTSESEEIFELDLNRGEHMRLFTEEIKKCHSEEIETSIHLLHILSSILEYGEKLEHLDQLITSLYKFHTDDEKPIISEE